MRRFQDPNFIPGADDIDGEGDPFDRYQTEYGQVDGDAAPPAQFEAYKPGGAGQPWLRSPLPPWHLWGNSQLVTTVVQDQASITRASVSSQLVKISYRRPESWNWLFAARMVSGPDSPGNTTTCFVWFNLTVGIGRAAIRMLAINEFQPQNAFELYRFTWGPIGTFPVNRQLYSTSVVAPNRTSTTDAPFPDQSGNSVPGTESAPAIDKIVAQDLQLEARILVTAPGGAASVGQPVTVEVSAQFAPSTHVRPDWYQEGMPPEVSFGGSEVGGT